MLKGKFKTAYLQKEIPMDIVVAGAADLHVGELVTFVAASGGKPAYITAATSLDTATHLIAQSDNTLEYGHVPVEDRNYAYSDIVKRSLTAGAPTTVSTLASTSESKKVAVFAITDKQDIITYNV